MFTYSNAECFQEGFVNTEFQSYIHQFFYKSGQSVTLLGTYFFPLFLRGVSTVLRGLCADVQIL